eukprot:14412817-Alexandrium_andersonii.AAC.1
MRGCSSGDMAFKILLTGLVRRHSARRPGTHASSRGQRHPNWCPNSRAHRPGCWVRPSIAPRGGPSIRLTFARGVCVGPARGDGGPRKEASGPYSRPAAT